MGYRGSKSPSYLIWLPYNLVTHANAVKQKRLLGYILSGDSYDVVGCKRATSRR